MAEVTMGTLGARVREERQRAGLSQHDLGERVRLDRTAINKIESGIRKVSALELSDVARALGVSMVSFFEEPVESVVAHRSSEGLDTADSQIDALLADLADDVRLVERIQKIVASPVREAWPALDSAPECEAMAERARHLLGCGTDEPARSLQDRMAAVGFLIFTRPLGADTADAGTVLVGDLGVGLLNASRKAGRRRLAAAHEFGHYLLKDVYTVDWRVASAEGPVESRLDGFARALLLPRAAVMRRWAELIKVDGLRAAAVVIGSEYQVDMSTLARRLMDLELIDAADAGEIRTVRTTSADMIEYDLYVHEELDGTSQPRRFQKAVLEAVRDEELAPARAIDLLWHLVDEADLPRPRPREQRDIWQYVS